MKPYYESGGVTIFHADCREVLPQLEPVDTVVTSPPYAEQRLYGLEPGQFVWNEVVPPALASVRLTENGQMLVNLGLIYRDGEAVEYWQPMIVALRAAGHRLFGWYVWDQGWGLPGDWRGRLAPSHEWIFHFNRQARELNKTEPCKVAGASREVFTRNRDGTLKSARSVCVQEFKVPDTVLRFPRLIGKNEGNGHPAQLPKAIASYALRTLQGQSVLDPFMGSGTTIVAAKELGMRAIGIEVDERYCEIAAKRLAQQVFAFDAPPIERHEQLEIT